MQEKSPSLMLLSLLMLTILLSSGCALWKAEEEKAPPCIAPPEGLAGRYGSKIPSADGSGRMIRMKLLADHRLEMATDYLDDKPDLIENGKWECRDGIRVIITLTGNRGKTYEKPLRLVFILDGDGLTAVEYNHDAWGEAAPHLVRNPTVTGTVWRLAQIQYANNTALAPDDPAKYALILSQDGTVTVRADCNRGMGTYLMAGNYLVMRKLAYTHMICMENSLFDQYTKALESAESCAIHEGDLYITLQTDSGIMKFEPAELGE
ncbi:MAG TPA: META domain-containing protein [Desulfomonilia bacterium]|nr:META domain-containing protein [Desulfomonilia bacterium]